MYNFFVNAPKVIEELKRKYPDKNIVQFPGEIICEIEPTSKHPEFSKAIAVIDQSIPHRHLKTQEDYTVLKGKLTLTVDDKEYNLPQGQSFVVQLGQIHSAKGEETWVEVVSTPGWTSEDHIIVK